MTQHTADLDSHARSYVDSVLEVQRRLGHESGLSEEDYRRAIDRAAAAFADLTTRDELDTDEQSEVA